MNFRASAEDAGWSLREAAWDLEEQVLWRGSDSSRHALARASRAMLPLQRLIQTRLIWPIEDVLNERSRRDAHGDRRRCSDPGACGGRRRGDERLESSPGRARHAPAASATGGTTWRQPDGALQGVTPQIPAGHAAPAPAQPPTKASAPPEQVAWQFAQAFVGYEVGHSNKKTDAAFAATATKPLAKSLSADPPRLPVERQGSAGPGPQRRSRRRRQGAGDRQRLARPPSGDQRGAPDPDEDRQRVAGRPGPWLMGRIRTAIAATVVGAAIAAPGAAAQTPPPIPPRRRPLTRRRRRPSLSRR